MTHPPTVIIMKANIAKWTLTFTVNLSLDKVDQVPKGIKDKIKFLGSYSLSQLSSDTTADLSSFDPELNHTPRWTGVQMQVHMVDGARGEVNGTSDMV